MLEMRTWFNLIESRNHFLGFVFLFYISLSKTWEKTYKRKSCARYEQILSND